LDTPEEYLKTAKIFMKEAKKRVEQALTPEEKVMEANKLEWRRKGAARTRQILEQKV